VLDPYKYILYSSGGLAFISVIIMIYKKYEDLRKELKNKLKIIIKNWF